MKFFVKFEAFESIVGDEETKLLRKSVGEQIQKIQESGKLVEGEVFVGMRGGFFLFDNIDNAAELEDLLGLKMHEHFKMETHATISFEELGEFFEREEG